MKIKACVLLVGLTIASAAQAAPSKEDYELQVRCGKQASEEFRREYGKGPAINTDDGQALVSYRNHFSLKLNKCMMLVSYYDVPFKNKSHRPSQQYTLTDINESRDWGTFFKFTEDAAPMECVVADRKCASEEEFKAALLPFMDQ